MPERIRRRHSDSKTQVWAIDNCVKLSLQICAQADAEVCVEDAAVCRPCADYEEKTRLPLASSFRHTVEFTQETQAPTQYVKYVAHERIVPVSYMPLN
jgi:hypothetical protein